MRTSNDNQNAATGGKRRRVKLPANSRITKPMIRALDEFAEYVPAARLSRNLRDLFLLYMAREEDGLPEGFDDFPEDLYLLLQFMDAVAEELEE